MRKIYLISVLILLCTPILSQTYNVSLTSWAFTIQNDTNTYQATIPSTLSLDLIDNGIISNDPYYRDNFLKYYNYQTKDASYSTQFQVSPTLLNSNHKYLIFEGLDTHAEVYLNGDHILSAHNMFRRYEVKVQFQQHNVLVVNFTSSVKYDLNKQKQFKEQNGFTLPQNYSFTRKAAYQYGWDWGPRILTVGIWKQVNVLIYNETRIEKLRLTHNPITKQISKIQCTFDAYLIDLDEKAVYNAYIQIVKQSNKQIILKDIKQIKNVKANRLQIEFSIAKNLKDYIWWTWDLGEPNLIIIDILIKNLNTSESISSSMTTGIRTISVIQQNKTFNGTSFKFNLNGYDVYMRGGNYIPPQMSLARTNWQTYQKIKQYALFAKFNMIRLWGGGQFDKDEFYDAMDQAGILIWHDLMFACALYPSSDQILQNIEAEMRDNVKRIRRHPSLGLWNGNNEIWIGWQEWGWKRSLTESQKQLVQKMYNDVFRVVLPKVLKEEHPQVFYWQTSPSVSSGSISAINSGDIHFWRVWGGGTKIQQYEQYVGRFNSQYGMQSMPDISTIMKFTAPSDRTINSYILSLHERHPYGDTYLPGYTFNYSGKTSNLTRFSYYSQVMQSYALEMAITSLRLNKPYNMGSLYWQLNDVWPVSSWATVDYYGNYKAAQYRIRQVYQQLMIHTLHDPKTGDYIVYIVNQKNITYYCQCKLWIQMYTGQISQLSFVIEKTVGPFERIMVRRFTQSQCSQYINSGFLKTQLRTSENHVSNNNFFFITMKNRPNLLPNLTVTFQGSNMKIKTNRLASYIWIFRRKGLDYIPLKLSNNYFTLSANEEQIVSIGTIPISQIFVTCYQLQYNTEKLSKIQRQQKVEQQ